MPVARRMWYLKQTDLFSDLEEHELQALARMVREREVPRRRSLHQPGESGDAVCVLKEGRVKISRVTGDGRKLTIDILEAGDLFGELAPGGEPADDVLTEALEDSYVCMMDRDQFAGLLGLRPELALRVVQMVDDRRRKAETRLRDILLYDVPTRLARVLLQLGEQHGIVTTRGIRLNLRLTHEELADLVGCARETVSGILAEFRARGLLDYRGREPLMLHPGLLCQQAALC